MAVTSRREFQKLCLDVLQAEAPTPSCEKLLDWILPSRHGVVIPSGARKHARVWIQELVDEGILVRDPDLDSKQGDCYRLNPGKIAGATAMERFQALQARRAPEISLAGKVGLTSCAALGALALALLYTFFLPPSILKLVGSAASVALGILAFLGYKSRGLDLSPVAAGRGWKAALLVGASATLVALVIFAWANPVRLRVLPGAEILIGGESRGTAEFQGSNAMGTERFWLSWEPQHVRVMKPWYVPRDLKDPRKAVLIHPWQGEETNFPMVCRLKVDLDEASISACFPGAEPKAEAARQWSRSLLGHFNEALLKSPLVRMDRILEVGGDVDPTLLLRCRMRPGDAPGSPRLEVIGATGADQAGERLLSLPYPGDAGPVQVARLLRNRLFEELAIAATPEIEAAWTEESEKAVARERDAKEIVRVSNIRDPHELDSYRDLNERRIRKAVEDLSATLELQGFTPVQAAPAVAGPSFGTLEAIRNDGAKALERGETPQLKRRLQDLLSIAQKASQVRNAPVEAKALEEAQSLLKKAGSARIDLQAEQDRLESLRKPIRVLTGLSVDLLPVGSARESLRLNLRILQDGQELAAKAVELPLKASQEHPAHAEIELRRAVPPKSRLVLRLEGIPSTVQYSRAGVRLTCRIVGRYADKFQAELLPARLESAWEVLRGGDAAHEWPFEVPGT